MRMMKGERFWCHYEVLEEYLHGMWVVTKGEVRERYIKNAVSLMSDADKFKEAMIDASTQWVNSCKFNFTTPTLNKVAWLGHAACSIGVGSPEDCTRVAWWKISQPQRDAANIAAQEVIQEWMAENIIDPIQIEMEWGNGA